MDTSEGQVFIGVYHDLNNTNLYMSEPAGLKYSLSLEHVISPPESDWTEGRVGFDVHVVSCHGDGGVEWGGTRVKSVCMWLFCG